jgi:hypothetical protein
VGIGRGADSCPSEVTLTVIVETIVARLLIAVLALLWFTGVIQGQA